MYNSKLILCLRTFSNASDSALTVTVDLLSQQRRACSREAKREDEEDDEDDDEDDEDESEEEGDEDEEDSDEN